MKKTPADIAMAKGYKCLRCKGTKFHMWTSTRDTEHVSCDKCQLTVEVMPKTFVKWWQDHHESGFAENREGTARYGISPGEAWGVDRYRVEFSEATGHYYGPEYHWIDGKSYERPIYTDEEKAKWKQNQSGVETMTGDLEVRFGPQFWETMTPQEFIANVKIIVREKMADNLAKSMKAKIDKAYEHEPGQSEEET